MPYKNIEDKRACDRRYYRRKNPKICFLVGKNKMGRNKETRLRSQAKWQKTEKGKANTQRSGAKRRAKMKLLINTLTAGEWIDILLQYRFRCAYCGKEFSLFNKETRDHVIPISEGGNNTKENIVPACQSCNSKKGAKKYLSQAY